MDRWNLPSAPSSSLALFALGAGIGASLVASALVAVPSMPSLSPRGTAAIAAPAMSEIISPARSHDALLDPPAPESWAGLAVDPESRLPDEFGIPSFLTAPVRFWLDVYGRYDSEQVILFDGRHPTVVYEVVDLAPLRQRARNRAAFEILSDRRIASRKRAYEAAFRELARSERAGSRTELSDEARVIREKVAALGHAHSWTELRLALRSQRGQRDAVAAGLTRMAPWEDGLRAILARGRVPEALLYLSLVESSFNTQATSRVGAAGPWQFMPAIARGQLLIDDRAGVDERRSPWKATLAAARLLAANHRGLKNWPLAVTAYNHGMRGISHFGRERPSEAVLARLFDGCHARRSPFGWASRNFYSEFLAMTLVASYRDRVFPELSSSEAPRLHARFWIADGRVNGADLMVRHGIGETEFRRLNPDLDSIRKRLPAGMRIALPAEELALESLIRHRASASSG